MMLHIYDSSSIKWSSNDQTPGNSCYFSRLDLFFLETILQFWAVSLTIQNICLQNTFVRQERKIMCNCVHFHMLWNYYYHDCLINQHTYKNELLLS